MRGFWGERERERERTQKSSSILDPIFLQCLMWVYYCFINCNYQHVWILMPESPDCRLSRLEKLERQHKMGKIYESTLHKFAWKKTLTICELFKSWNWGSWIFTISNMKFLILSRELANLMDDNQRMYPRVSTLRGILMVFVWLGSILQFVQI